MATLGPTATTVDVSSFANFATWAGTGTFGIHTALANFGWTQTVDGNQLQFITNGVALVLTSVATSIGSTAVYTGTITGGGSNAFAGFKFTVAGFTTGANNGTFLCSASTTTTLTLNNASAVAETHAATATPTSAVPFTGATYLITNMPTTGYFINTRGSWVSGTNYAVGDIVFDVTTNASYYTFLAITNSTTVPSSDTTHFFVYHYEMWQTNDSVTFSETSQTVSYVSSTQVLTIGTTTNPNRFKAGFIVTISGATNLPQINGTWTVASATTTQLTFSIPNTLPSFGSNFSGTDTYSIAYTFQPICMKLEYFGYTGAFSAAPWIRVSFGNGTDGFGNLTGNVVGSTNCGTATGSSQGFVYLDLVSSQTAAGAQTSTIWRCISSGSNGRFGATMFYNRNDTNATNASSLYWLVERAKDNNGNDIDDYYTYIAGVVGASTVFGASSRFNNQRSILKWNPQVNVNSISIDSTNDLIFWYKPFGGTGSYQFTAGATTFVSGLQQASFLNDQFLYVLANTLTLTSVANASGGNTVYTGTITGGTTQAYVGQLVNITGFTNGANNGTFTVVSSTATTITLNNAGGVAETHAATVNGTTSGYFLIASFTHAALATTYDVGTARLTISGSTFTPIVGTGLPCLSDPNICTIMRQNGSLLVNGQTPLLPVFTFPGFLGNPMTMAASLTSNDEPAHDTTFSIQLYGTTRTYYFPQGSTPSVAPYLQFGDTQAVNTFGQNYGFAMRWD